MASHAKKDKKRTSKKSEMEEPHQEKAIDGGQDTLHGAHAPEEHRGEMPFAERSALTLPESEIDIGEPYVQGNAAHEQENAGGNLFEKFDLEELLAIESSTQLQGSKPSLEETREIHGPLNESRQELPSERWPEVNEELPEELFEEKIEISPPLEVEERKIIPEKTEPLVIVDEFWGQPGPGDPDVPAGAAIAVEPTAGDATAATDTVDDRYQKPAPSERHYIQEVEEIHMIDNGRAGEQGTAVRERDEKAAATISDSLQPNPLSLEKPQLIIDAEEYLTHIWESNQDIYAILSAARTLENAREELYSYLDRIDRHLLTDDMDLHILERGKIRESIEVLRKVISPLSEAKTGISALDCLWKLANDRTDDLEWELTVGFILEFVHLFRAISGNAYMFREGQLRKDERADYLNLKGREAAQRRSESYEDLTESIKKHFKKFTSGLEEDVILWRKANVNRILKYFKGDRKEWNDYTWQMRHIVRDLTILQDLVELSEDQKEAIKIATELKIPVAITPYYLSLMDRVLSVGLDHAIRSRIIPTLEYVRKMAASKEWEFEARHLSEPETSPVDRVVLRHPMTIAITPFARAPQSILYCQRNWEIEECLVPDPKTLGEEFDVIIEWMEENPGIGEIFVTGGDLIMLEDRDISDLLGRLAEFKNIYRICIDTRTPVTLPMRWTDALLDIIDSLNSPGTRQLSLITHFEHPYEITPDCGETIQKIRKRGIEVFNQHMVSLENSRRFEISKLRHDLGIIGVVPLYGFNGSGDEASRLYMVPLARILQEQKEEASLMPGLTWTDKALSHLPVLGRNNIDGWQGHSLIMIRPEGSRVYELHPQQNTAQPIDPYYYNDIPIYDYLQEIAARGENPRDYKNIWFYY
jgi:lysine 2,3-aminomutase